MRKNIVIWFPIILVTIISASTMTASAQVEDDIYHIPEEKESSTSLMEYIIPFGIGIGYGQMKPINGIENNSLDIEFIGLNFLTSVRLGKFIDSGVDESHSVSSLQFGILVPTIGFGSEGILGRKHKCRIFVAPLVEFVNITKTHYDGDYLHENIPFHHCAIWIDKSKTYDYSSTGFGGAILLKYNMGYVLGKFTNKGFGVSLGFCI